MISYGIRSNTSVRTRVRPRSNESVSASIDGVGNDAMRRLNRRIYRFNRIQTFTTSNNARIDDKIANIQVLSGVVFSAGMTGLVTYSIRLRNMTPTPTIMYGPEVAPKLENAKKALDLAEFSTIKNGKRSGLLLSRRFTGELIEEHANVRDVMDAVERYGVLANDRDVLRRVESEKKKIVRAAVEAVESARRLNNPPKPQRWYVPWEKPFVSDLEAFVATYPPSEALDDVVEPRAEGVDAMMKKRREENVEKSSYASFFPESVLRVVAFDAESVSARRTDRDTRPDVTNAHFFLKVAKQIGSERLAACVAAWCLADSIRTSKALGEDVGAAEAFLRHLMTSTWNDDVVPASELSPECVAEIDAYVARVTVDVDARAETGADAPVV